MITLIIIGFAVVGMVVVARLFILGMFLIIPVFLLLFTGMMLLEPFAVAALLLIFLWVSSDKNFQRGESIEFEKRDSDLGSNINRTC
jgi:energy-coupling factor transporter transmembrane protein EcfT